MDCSESLLQGLVLAYYDWVDSAHWERCTLGFVVTVVVVAVIVVLDIDAWKWIDAHLVGLRCFQRFV